jgi:Tol biopolymer transport system component
VRQPTWAPDGQKIGFTTDVSGHHEIFTINLDGSELHDSSPGGAVDQDAAWSYRLSRHPERSEGPSPRRSDTGREGPSLRSG